jgi:hypothetical protein
MAQLVGSTYVYFMSSWTKQPGGAFDTPFKHAVTIMSMTSDNVSG